MCRIDVGRFDSYVACYDPVMHLFTGSFLVEDLAPLLSADVDRACMVQNPHSSSARHCQMGTSIEAIDGVSDTVVRLPLASHNGNCVCEVNSQAL